MSGPRRTPLIALLGRLRWQRDPELWTVPCRDEHGRKAVLSVEIHTSGVVIRASTPGAVALPPLMIGRLRAALRDAVVAHAVLSGDQRSSTKEVDSEFGDPFSDRHSTSSDAA